MCCELTKKLDLAFFEVCNIELVHVSLSHPGQIVYGKPRLLLSGRKLFSLKTGTAVCIAIPELSVCCDY